MLALQTKNQFGHFFDFRSSPISALGKISWALRIPQQTALVTPKSQYQKRCTKNIGEIDKWSDNHIFLSWLPTQGTSQVVLAFVPGKMWSRAQKIHKNRIESAYTLVYILDCVVYCTMVANFLEEFSFCAGLAPSKSWTMSWKLRTACDTAGNIIAKQDRPTQKCHSIWSLDILHHLSPLSYQK